MVECTSFFGGRGILNLCMSCMCVFMRIEFSIKYSVYIETFTCEYVQDNNNSPFTLKTGSTFA
jgi:hypothetical protein